jgi:hypothetical protein
MWVMKNTTDTDGRHLFGSQFASYDRLVARHIHAALNTNGDAGHFAPVFPVWHRAFLLQFENSLLSIDPSIGGCPYWDYRLDETDPHSSVMFGSDFFGSLRGDAAGGYALRGGPFAHWRIMRAATAKEHGFTNITSPYGFLRNPLSPNPHEYLTRRGGSLCGRTGASAFAGSESLVGSAAKWTECLAKNLTFSEWFYCMDAQVHGAAHHGVGGAWGRFQVGRLSFSSMDILVFVVRIN